MIRFHCSIFLSLVLGFATSGQSQESPQRLGGVCFSSVRDNESPARQIGGLPSTVEQDVKSASRLARSIRTYTVQGTSSLIPEYCQDHGVDCIVGAWIGPNRWQNDAQLEHLINLSNVGNSRIKAVIIGNEVLHRGDCEETQLIEYVRLAKSAIELPIAVADTWKAWVEHPNLAEEVDICGVQIYPYWEGLPVEGAAAYTLRRLREVQETYPDKKVVLTEFGWPTAGDTLGEAEANPENAARYLREIIPLLEESGVEYYYFAIWDEKWKVGPEGGVGAHWGLFHSDGSIKPAFKDSLHPQTHAGSTRPPRVVTFPLPVDQPRNAAVRIVAIGEDDADPISKSLAQRGAGLENSLERAGSSSYAGLRPIQRPKEPGREDAPTQQKQADASAEASDKAPSIPGSTSASGNAGTVDDGVFRSAATGKRDHQTESSPHRIGQSIGSEQAKDSSDTDRIHGVCLSLFRDNESPHFGIAPLVSELRGDVQYAKRLAKAVRTYSVADSFSAVPEICNEIGVDCYPGAALGKYPWLNDLELEMLVRVGKSANPRVKALIVGNEVMHRGDFSPEQYVEYIRRVKRQVDVPVATAELLHSWLEHPELAAEVDILGVQIYPYWGGVPIDAAAENTIESVQELQRRFPGKRVILTEFGWPTDGGTIGGAVASPENAARYFREVLPLLSKNDIEYFYFAMTDEKWKQQDEGGPGAHWGLFQSNGKAKKCFDGLLPEDSAMGTDRPPRRLTFDD